MLLTEKEKMAAGELYLSGDKELVQNRVEAQELIYQYNYTRGYEEEHRKEILKLLLEICRRNNSHHANISL